MPSLVHSSISAHVNIHHLTTTSRHTGHAPSPCWQPSMQHRWSYDLLGTIQHILAHLTALFWDYPGEPVPERQNQSGFHWSKRQWVAMASAGPYASLHLIPDNRASTAPLSFLQARCPVSNLFVIIIIIIIIIMQQARRVFHNQATNACPVNSPQDCKNRPVPFPGLTLLKDWIWV